jgi:ComF family protein
MYGYKYHGDIRSIGWMAILAARAHKIKFSRFDGVTYVPRSKSGIKRHGYDQSLAAAEAISKKFGVPLLHLLENKGDGEQKLLSRNQRMKNIRSRFALKNIPSEKYKKILLVDDISTTGATVGACAALLREEAASSVVKLVISKTVLLK